jgi:multicomponent Na+:H+ antiporter subunit E
VILELTLLALAWMALTGDWSLPALAFSGALGWLLLRLARPLGGEGFRRVRLARLPGFLLYFLKEVVVANLKVAAAVIAPRGRLRPAIVAVPLALDRDAEIALLANLITLTPGTLSLDVSPDRRTLYVHAMAVTSPDDLRREIRDGFERRILEVFR